MSDEKRARLKEWLASGEARLQPLSLPQRELWEATPVPPGDAANHICSIIHVRGKLTPQNCPEALQIVVERQEVLRLSILPGRDGALQMIRKTSEANLVYRELSAAESTPEAIEEQAQSVFRKPFDLLQGPLYRAEVMKRGPEDHVLAFAIHHAIGDGWSLGVFVQDLACAYAQGLLGKRDERLPPVPLSYTEWAAAERAYWQPAEVAKRADFWKTTLAGSRRLWPNAEPGPPWELERTVTAISGELCAAVRELARQAGATLFSTLLAAFQIALARWSGVHDLVVGTPVANRNRKAAHETMGYFAGIVPMRGQAEPTRPFADKVREVHQSTMDAFANALPFAELVKTLGGRNASGAHPIFDVRFALQNHPVPDIEFPSLSARLRMRSTGTARFHLGCELTEDGDGLEVVWLARRTVVSPNDISQLDGMFQKVLSEVSRAPQSRTATATL
ncbi:MAG TPA: condensation domain-containing protein [Chthoniobacteraceae bacterium]|jgi:hypothetical protein|nr:condensation domain-containing protein [Chthoniobacteraceae bacterium]